MIITPGTLAAYLKNAGIEFINVKECDVCNQMTSYRIINDTPYYDANCACGSEWKQLDRREWQDLVDWYDRQETELDKEIVAKKLGIYALMKDESTNVDLWDACELIRKMKLSMGAHPDCVEGSEFQDYVEMADEFLNKHHA